MAISANSNGRSVRDLVIIAMLTALAVIVSFVVDIPILAAAPYLTYDPSNVIVMTGSFAYGPGAGCIIAFVSCLIHGSSSGVWGVVMNSILSVSVAASSGLLFKHLKTRYKLIVSLLLSAVIFVIFAVLMNLIITPIYTGMSIEDIAAMIIPVFLPFNLIKAAINVAITLPLYKAVERFMLPALYKKKAAANND